MAVKRKLTQAMGAQQLDVLREGQAPQRLQIQVTVYNSGGAVAAPAAGTLTVKVRTPGAVEHETIENGTIDLTVRDNWLQVVDVVASSVEVTPTGLDASATYDVLIV